jgi:hypothetical protein
VRAFLEGGNLAFGDDFKEALGDDVDVETAKAAAAGIDAEELTTYMNRDRSLDADTDGDEEGANGLQAALDAQFGAARAASADASLRASMDPQLKELVAANDNFNDSDGGMGADSDAALDLLEAAEAKIASLPQHMLVQFHQKIEDLGDEATPQQLVAVVDAIWRAAEAAKEARRKATVIESAAVAKEAESAKRK